MKLTTQELATVLAALRFYQSEGLADDPCKRSDDIHRIATSEDNETSLDGRGIDRLCDRLNRA